MLDILKSASSESAPRSFWSPATIATASLLAATALTAGAYSIYRYVSRNTDPPTTWAPRADGSAVATEAGLRAALRLEMERRQRTIAASSVPQLSVGLKHQQAPFPRLTDITDAETLKIACAATWQGLSDIGTDLSPGRSEGEKADGVSTTLEALAQSERANALFEDFRTSIVSDILDSATYARTTYNDLLRAKADLAQHTKTNTDLRSNPTSHASTTHQHLTRTLATAEKAFSLASQLYAAASSFVFATTPADLTNKMNLLAPPGEWVHDAEDESESGSEAAWHETHDGKKILLGQGATVAAFHHPDAQRMRVALCN